MSPIPHPGLPRGAGQPLAEGLALGALFLLFGLSVRGRPLPEPLAAAALLAAAGLCFRMLREPDGSDAVFGTWGASRARWLAGGSLAGSLLAAVWRVSEGVPALPPHLTAFAAVAALIGATEEIVFRGFIQGGLRRLGPATAIGVAACLHTGYKVALVVSPGAGEAFNLEALIVCTLAGGALFGTARACNGSVWPCVAAHAAFDIIGYGDRVAAPVWVWG